MKFVCSVGYAVCLGGVGATLASGQPENVILWWLAGAVAFGHAFNLFNR